MWINVPRTTLSSELIRTLGNIKALSNLNLPNARATDATLAELCRTLKDHPNFTVVALGETQVTEAGMKELRHLRHLKCLYIESPHVKDPGAYNGISLPEPWLGSDWKQARERAD